jgi:hypothetical protein
LACHDVSAILTLFDHNVEYYETPYRHLSGLNQIKKEWQTIKHQHQISLDLQLFNSQQNKHTVQWFLDYRDESGQTHRYSGTYLIRLNPDNQCTYFYQTFNSK